MAGACPKCGRPVSANKLYCMTCIEEIAQATVEAREEEPMPETTHIITGYDSKDQEDLYRADGMLVASRQSDVVRFGHDISTAQSRLFLNAGLAKAWLRKVAAIDLHAQEIGVPLHEVIWGSVGNDHAPVFEERNAESILTLPGNDKSIRMH